MSKLTLHLASGNAHKAREIQILADASGLSVLIKPAEAMPSVEEDTGSFAGNARKKAQALRATLPKDSWVLADDSGVCVDALGGAPGVESAYYAGPHSDPAANLRKLVEVMRPVPTGSRGAYFFCLLAILGPDALDQTFEGRCEGVLIDEPRGGSGFGYDPLFVPENFDETYAELGEAVKNQISHRAKAWTALAHWLRAHGVA